MKKESNFKVCNRGHKYIGKGSCPVCWPGRYKGKKARLAVRGLYQVSGIKNYEL
ncbi:MAG: hypothetical protein UT84_C0003G0033 [Candidatus Curtissbacteria bacterium GW2011_GWA1_40_16]|uniref:Uncharacterized protein n=1 Tax=Candidatus Curtissbacteria bacterium GW2011_GWA1_40_16 TaxID=1618405 RepID=A0A0G0RF11_9BACT|nr:MAG: hypothetical protein UT84_C0003G0033 [Candidatus Curtissbacteria bacterium GW2011_GWA1_40_16]